MSGLVALPPYAQWTLGNRLDLYGNNALARLTPEANVAALLHFEGTPASQVYTDSSDVPHSFSNTGTNAALFADTYVFGTSSLYCYSNGSGIISPDHDDWFFGSGDFTIEMRWMPHSFGGSGVSCLVAQFQDANNQWYFYYYNNAFYFHEYLGGGYSFRFSVPSGTITFGVWYAICLERYGNTWNIYINGVAGTKTLQNGAYSIALTNLNGALTIGCQTFTPNQNGTHHIDEFRLSKSAKYQGQNYTPSTVAFSKYSALSPVVESPWVACPYKTVVAVTVIENILGGTGNIKYQYALNNGAYNGAWLTQSALNTAIANATITNVANSLRLKAQLNSDGAQLADIGTGYITASNLDYPANDKVEAGTVYAVGTQTGTLVASGGSRVVSPYGNRRLVA